MPSIGRTKSIFLDPHIKVDCDLDIIVEFLVYRDQEQPRVLVHVDRL